MRRVPLLLPARKHWAVGQHLYWELFSQSISMGLMSSIVSAGSVVLLQRHQRAGHADHCRAHRRAQAVLFTSMPLMSPWQTQALPLSPRTGVPPSGAGAQGNAHHVPGSVVIMAANMVLMQLFARQLVQLSPAPPRPSCWKTAHGI